MFRSSFATLDAAGAPFALWKPLRFANGILSLAAGNIDYELGKLVWIAGSFGHGLEYATGQWLI